MDRKVGLRYDPLPIEEFKEVFQKNARALRLKGLLLQVPSPCDVEALKKCLERHDGDSSKCQQEVLAFSSSCSAAVRDKDPKK